MKKNRMLKIKTINLRNNGLTLKQIASEIGVGKSTVGEWLKKDKKAADKHPQAIQPKQSICKDVVATLEQTYEPDVEIEAMRTIIAALDRLNATQTLRVLCYVDLRYVKNGDLKNEK